MTDKQEVQLWGVVCIHCRLQTPVAPLTQPELPEKKLSLHSNHISIVRCAKCGREAPYLVNELVAIKNVASPRMWAA